jgi:hypothetical protein
MISSAELNEPMERLLEGWGYGEEQRHMTELLRAHERIKELEIELKVTKRLLDSALKLAFNDKGCSCGC